MMTHSHDYPIMLCCLLSTSRGKRGNNINVYLSQISLTNTRTRSVHQSM